MGSTDSTSRSVRFNGELLAAAVSGGVHDQRVEAYVNSFVRFATPYLERSELLEPLGSTGSYTTTECEILESFPDVGASLSREQGLWLVRESCRRLEEQVSSLRRRYDETLPGEGRQQRAANVVWIGTSPTVSAGVESRTRPQPGHAAGHQEGLPDGSAKRAWKIDTNPT